MSQLEQAPLPREARQASPDPGDLAEQERVRRQKRERMLSQGCEPYPVAVARDEMLASIRSEHAAVLPATATGKSVRTAGRVISQRDMGGILFATLREGGGSEVQMLLTQDQAGEQAIDDWRERVDIGDIVAVSGEVITTSRGEITVATDRWEMAAKALRSLPGLRHPLTDELRVRQRYVDLIVRPAAHATVRTRATVMRSLRESFHRRDYLEVETPLLHTIPGGANARPFVTRSNALDSDLYLRIAPELFLKRCIVGGIDRVYEINRNFRNEGVDSSHSPEFSAVEAYASFADYRDMAVLTRELVQDAVLAATGGLVAVHEDGSEVDFAGEWAETTLYGSLSEALGEEITPATSLQVLLRAADRVALPFPRDVTPARLAESLFDAIVAPTLQQPTFVFDYPVETSPLTRAHRQDPSLAEKWDLYVRGMELATAYSELTDPVLQRERFLAQARRRDSGDAEAMPLDEDFLRAIEHGMPPTGGMGMGVDRLLMAITGLGIRETILFPLNRVERM